MKRYAFLLLILPVLFLTACTTTEEVKNDFHNVAIDVYLAYDVENDGNTISITKDGDEHVYIVRREDKGIDLEDLIEIQLDDETTLVEKEEFENGDGAIFNDKERGEFFEYRIKVGDVWYRCSSGIYGPQGNLIKMIKSMRPVE